MKKRCISIGVSLLLLVLIYRKVDFEAVIRVFGQSSVVILIIGLAMFVPLLFATSLRLCLLMPADGRIGLMESIRLNLMAAVLNMVLPSKMGDIAKAGFMSEQGHMSRPLSLSLVIFEKACDMASLLFWCAIGLLFLVSTSGDLLPTLAFPVILAGLTALILLMGSKKSAGTIIGVFKRLSPSRLRPALDSFSASWNQMHGYFWSNRRKLLITASVSVAIWLLHLLQIWIFTVAIGAGVPFLSAIALSPLAILAGLLPFTFAGVGTRDAALVLLFQPFMPAADAAAIGLLCTMRYFLPALAGLPLLSPALQSIADKRKRERGDINRATP